MRRPALFRDDGLPVKLVANLLKPSTLRWSRILDSLVEGNPIRPLWRMIGSTFRNTVTKLLARFGNAERHTGINGDAHRTHDAHSPSTPAGRQAEAPV